MNNELREKETSRDYHLKRTIIYSLIFTTSPFLTVGNVALFVILIRKPWEEKINELYKKNKIDRKEEKRRKKFAKTTCWTGGIILEILIFLLPLTLAIYHFYKFWKAYKACQELASLTLAAETATESKAEREREREENKFVGW